MRRRAFGTIEKLPSGNYRAYWRNEGKNVRAPHTFPNKRAAQDWLANQQAQFASGQITPDRPAQDAEKQLVTLNQWKEIWLERCQAEKTLTPKTIQTYKSGYKTHLEKPFGHRILSTITVDDIREWYTGFDPTKPGAKKTAYRTLSTLLRAAVSEGLLDKSPAQLRGAMSKTRRGLDNPRAIVATPEQVRELAEAMPENLAITVLLGFWCSMRFGEITELRRKDIELGSDRALVRVRRAVQYAAGFGYTVGLPKTAAGVRDIAVPSAMVPDLRKHLEQFVGESPDALLVHSPADSSRWLSNNSLNHYFKKAVAAVEGLDSRFVFHGLRHSGLTHAGQCGATLAELLRRAGHSDVETVLIYQHATRERDAALAERMSAGV